MLIGKMKWKRKIGMNRLLEQYIKNLILLERNRVPTKVMYHGTSSKFLKNILSNGLVPNPKQKAWDEDKDAETNPGQITRRSVGGVYFANNFLTATSSAKTTVDKFGGEELVIIANIQERSAFADEDTLRFKLERLVHQFAEESGLLSGNNKLFMMGYFLGVGELPQGNKVLYKNFANTANSFLGRSKQPANESATRDFLDSYLEMEYAKYMAMKDNYYYKKEFISGYAAAYRGKDAEGINAREKEAELYYNMPEYEVRESEEKYLKSMDALTRSYKQWAVREPNSVIHTLRVDDVVNFRGRNKIVCMFIWRTREDYDDPNDKTTATIVYGDMPEEAKQDIKRSWGGFEVIKNGKMVDKVEKYI